MQLTTAEMADAARVIEWATTKPRKPAVMAFTAGPERQAAYWIEWAESRAALAEQAQPVAWRHKDGGHFTTNALVSKFVEWEPLYTTPPAPQPLTEREIELIDGMIDVQLHHAAQCDLMLARAGGNHIMAERQKSWDMERIELLRKIRSMGVQR